MKKLMFAFCMMLGATVAVNAQDSTSTSTQNETQYRTDDMSQDQDREKEKYDQKDVIAVSELPQNVQDQLQGNDYSGWTVANSYRKEKEGKVLYAVELKNGSESKIVKFDAEGNKLKEKTKENDDQK